VIQNQFTFIVKMNAMPSKFSPVLRLILMSGLIFIAFCYGAAVGKYQWPPFYLAKETKDGLWRVLAGSSDNYQRDTEALYYAFTDPLIPDEKLTKPITSLDGVLEANRSMMLMVEDFYDAYRKLELVEASPVVLDGGATNVLKLAYKLARREYHTYAYAIPGHGARTAAIIIPGSGFNQSFAIYKRDRSNYHFGILEALDNSIDKFVFIKPNESCAAFHNGKAKLSDKFIINWLLNNGASYSAHYIASTLAITKYLQSRYDKVIVIGMSEGGQAAVLNSLQSEPDAAIIASGISIIEEKAEWSDHSHIIIPGLSRRISFAAMRSKIQQSKTRYLFTYGRNERGNYRVEAEEGLICKYLSAPQNVECKSHEGAHVFPRDTSREFLTRFLTAESGLLGKRK
jgi:hypothetical protein